MYKINFISIFLLIICICVIYGDNDIEKRKNNFINEGFGFEYVDEEIENIDFFISNHGNPLNIYEEGLENVWDNIKDTIITLEYNEIIVKYGKWRVRNVNTIEYKSLLLSIESKDKINYLYDVKHDMTKDELEKILGKIEFRRDDAFVLLQNDNNHYVFIYFYKNKIEKIVWKYSLD
jgi:hypothetical protein